MKKFRIIGDIHAKKEPYEALLTDTDYSIQIGDFGIGFGVKPLDNPNHRFIRGNHDDPSACRKFLNFIKDGHVEEISGGGHWMAIGGAFSIDWMYRQEGRSWWRDEECHEFAFRKFIEIYEKVKPEVMFTHDCPYSVAVELFGEQIKNSAVSSKIISPSYTSTWLDLFKDSYKPNLWIFGHWHIEADKVIDGTRYICLSELGYMDIEL